MIEIDDRTSISEAEISFRFSRSGGPGGQNVNRRDTRVTLLFKVADSASLSVSQQEQILARLAKRIDQNGVLHVTSSEHRTQEANRRAVLERFADLLASALKPIPARRRTRVPAGERRRRLESKRRRAETKRVRGQVRPPADSA